MNDSQQRLYLTKFCQPVSQSVSQSINQILQ